MAISRGRLYLLRELSEESGLSYYYLRNACLDDRLKHIRCGVKFKVRGDWFETFLEEESRGGGLNG